MYSSPVLASSTDTDDNIIARYTPECGRYATHDMLSAGWGDIINASTGAYVVNMGAAYQCTRCHLVLVCQNEPNNGMPCGYWTTN